MSQVLLVEPDHVLAKTYASALMAEGHHVLRAQDAQSAINATDAALPDLIILEIQLPHHNGVEFLYELRSHSDWQAIPVLILSSLESDRLNLASADQSKLGINGYYYKSDTSLEKLCWLVDESIGVNHE